MAVLAVSVSLLLCEGVVRLAGAGGTTLTRGRLHAYDPDAGWVCAPGLDVRYAQPGSFDVLVRTNGRGLRDHEHTFAKPEGVVRVACLGDSFMWGYGVENEEMISSALERSLPGVETINLGANGYSTVQALVRLETEALAYEPDWALLTFCWNDLEDNFDDKDGGRPVVRIGEGEPRIVNRPVRRPWKSPLKQWFRGNSRLFSFGEYCWELIKLRTRSSRGEPTQGEVASSAKVAPVRVDAVPSQVITELAPQPVSSGELAEVDEEALALTLLQVDVGIGPELERAWEAERWLVKQLRDTMVRSGGRLMVAYVTTREEVDEELFARWLASLSPGAPIAAIDPHRGAARLGQICEELGVPFVDLVPAFDAYGDPAALFIPANGHWSAEGHALAAAVVAERLAALMDS